MVGERRPTHIIDDGGGEMILLRTVVAACKSDHRKSLAKTVAITTYDWTYLALARLIINNKQLKSS